MHHRSRPPSSFARRRWTGKMGLNHASPSFVFRERQMNIHRGYCWIWLSKTLSVYRWMHFANCATGFNINWYSCVKGRRRGATNCLYVMCVCSESQCAWLDWAALRIWLESSARASCLRNKRIGAATLLVTWECLKKTCTRACAELLIVLFKKIRIYLIVP